MLKRFISYVQSAADITSIQLSIRQWLAPLAVEPRSDARRQRPEIVVFYWDGSSPDGRQLRDVSNSGAFVLTTDRWYPGTIIRLVLQGLQTTRREDGSTAPSVSFCIPSRVVRFGPDGVAVEFLFASPEEQKNWEGLLAGIPSRETIGAIPAGVPDAGHSLVEFALVLPLILLLAINLVNIGGFFFAWITIANGARTGAEYMAMSTASLGKPAAPTSAQVTTLVSNDISSLLNRSSLVVRVCTNNNGTIACAGGGSRQPPADPEPAFYTLGSVDVTYSYQPFITAWTFSGLGISATLPASTIHQRAVVRLEQ